MPTPQLNFKRCLWFLMFFCKNLAYCLNYDFYDFYDVHDLLIQGGSQKSQKSNES
jgi:hypothetical protein